jgi:hypothetical protein
VDRTGYGQLFHRCLRQSHGLAKGGRDKGNLFVMIYQDRADQVSGVGDVSEERIKCDLESVGWRHGVNIPNERSSFLEKNKCPTPEVTHKEKMSNSLFLGRES